MGHHPSSKKPSSRGLGYTEAIKRFKLAVQSYAKGHAFVESKRTHYCCSSNYTERRLNWLEDGLRDWKFYTPLKADMTISKKAFEIIRRTEDSLSTAVSPETPPDVKTDPIYKIFSTPLARLEKEMQTDGVFPRQSFDGPAAIADVNQGEEDDPEPLYLENDAEPSFQPYQPYQSDNAHSYPADDAECWQPSYDPQYSIDPDPYVPSDDIDPGHGEYPTQQEYPMQDEHAPDITADDQPSREADADSGYYDGYADMPAPEQDQPESPAPPTKSCGKDKKQKKKKKRTDDMNENCGDESKDSGHISVEFVLRAKVGPDGARETEATTKVSGAAKDVQSFWEASARTPGWLDGMNPGRLLDSPNREAGPSSRLIELEPE
ncbi:hypothetical protein B0T16DRAFT_441721 [Cercophora newfieldiana]|uniref:Uncharacterized protein n=1 Tax=Cercophora newfieldiana TaxID=92897 RepID=A0AA39YQP0_9PEZI|nr:hypothetical protein B0T16DRAFT_441721 [Cercophora newfieldiana]